MIEIRSVRPTYVSKKFYQIRVKKFQGTRRKNSKNSIRNGKLSLCQVQEKSVIIFLFRYLILQTLWTSDSALLSRLAPKTTV